MIAFSSREKFKLYCIPLIIVLSLNINESKAQKPNWKNVKVLVYTKNGKGYVRDNIPYAVKCIQKLGKENGFQVDVSDETRK